MDICTKCNNVNIEWNGAWKQCRNCGEVLGRKETLLAVDRCTESPWKQIHRSVNDIAALPEKATLMGKLTSRLHLMM